jgi:hypothetical protein
VIVASADDPYGRRHRRRRRGSAVLRGHMRARSEPPTADAIASLDATDDDDDDSITDERVPSPPPTALPPSSSSSGFRGSIARYFDARSHKRNVSYRKLFNLPDSEAIVVDWQSSLIKSGGLLHSGRLYIGHKHLCFYSNIFGIKTKLVMPVGRIVTIKKGGAFGFGGIVSIVVRTADADDSASLKKHKFVLMGINLETDITILRMVVVCFCRWGFWGW